MYVQLYDRSNTSYLRGSYEHDLSKRDGVSLHYTPSGTVLQTCVSKGTNEVMDAVVSAVDHIRRNGLTYHQFQNFLERSHIRTWRRFLLASKTFEQKVKIFVLRIGIHISDGRGQNCITII
jgi:hypothetical protein